MVAKKLAAGLTALAACSSSPPKPAAPPPAPVPVDAAVDAPAPDAGIPQAVLDAPKWVFGYHTKDRSETWTLQIAGGSALLVVEGKTAQRYTGTASEGEPVKLDVSTGTAKLALECKHASRPLGTKCNDAKAKPVEVLDCFHPDFKTPMTFGAAPGVEYVVDATCSGFRLAK
jgi:hypothetical protein